jgi:hypothetical protein
MAVLLNGTNGLIQAYDYQTPLTGFSYTFAAGTQTLVMNPATTLAAGTITMPAAPSDGMTITFSSTKQITALTLNGNTGQTVVGAPAQLAANSPVSFVYRLTNTTWYVMASAGENIVSAAASGYQKLASGLIVQWGITGTVLDASYATVTFPITFPNGWLCGLGCNSSASAGGNYGGATVGNATTSTMRVGHYNGGGNSSAMYWVAIGY